MGSPRGNHFCHAKFSPQTDPPSNFDPPLAAAAVACAGRPGADRRGFE
jgi:hypothetical protein